MERSGLNTYDVTSDRTVIDKTLPRSKYDQEEALVQSSSLIKRYLGADICPHCYNRYRDHHILETMPIICPSTKTASISYQPITEFKPKEPIKTPQQLLDDAAYITGLKELPHIFEAAPDPDYPGYAIFIYHRGEFNERINDKLIRVNQSGRDKAIYEIQEFCAQLRAAYAIWHTSGKSLASFFEFMNL
jgi:hypothetical protein